MRLALSFTFLALFTASACSEFLAIERRELRESNVAEVRKVNNNCNGTKIHNGDLLNTNEKEKYRNVGFVLVFKSRLLS